MDDLRDWQPRPRPERVELQGKFCRLEPLDPARHGDELFAAAMAPGAEERFRGAMRDLRFDRDGELTARSEVLRLRTFHHAGARRTSAAGARNGLDPRPADCAARAREEKGDPGSSPG